MLFPSLIGSAGLFLLGRRFRVWWRVSAAAVLALLAALVSVLAFDAIYGALTGASAALIGVNFFGALTFVAFVAACQAVVGLAGTGLAALALLFAGNAVSGGSLPFAFLPGGFQQAAPWLPNGAVVSAGLHVVYLPDTGLGHPLFVLWGYGWPGRCSWWPGWTCCTWPNVAAHHNGVRGRSTRRRAGCTCGGCSPGSGLWSRPESSTSLPGCWRRPPYGGRGISRTGPG
jgi:hypothetical protein